MPGSQDFFVRFWGVRGSIACAGPDTVRYGGNTSTLEVRCGENLLILDAGTGLRNLGNSLSADAPLSAHVLLTHTHFDHICGIPFFQPVYRAENSFGLWAGHLPDGKNISDVMVQMMAPPLFPVPPEIFRARISFHDFRAGETISPYEDVKIRTAPLNHPNGATAYRIEHQDRSICYLTDHEHDRGPADAVVVDLIRDADIAIYDATFTDDEYEQCKGMGHSTWREGVRIAEAANVGQYVVFHHNPEHDDDFMDGIARDVAELRPGSIVAREGMVLYPGRLEPGGI